MEQFEQARQAQQGQEGGPSAGLEMVEVVKPRHPALELLERYRAIFGMAWAARHDMAGPRRLADETAFLPAALSLQDTPVHPAPCRLAFALMALFVIAVLWACFGKIDIVATAPGRIIVSDRTKVIQPLEASVVRRVLVRDGDRVQAGQVLVELDPTMANADRASVQEQLSSAVSEEQRTGALMNAIASGSLPVMAIATSDSMPRRRADAQATYSQLIAEWQDINAKMSKLDAELVRHQAEIGTVRETIAKLEATIPMVLTREADFKRLVSEGFISSHATQDKTRERVEMERDLATQRAKLVEAQSTVKESERTKADMWPKQSECSMTVMRLPRPKFCSSRRTNQKLTSVSD